MINTNKYKLVNNSQEESKYKKIFFTQLSGHSVEYLHIYEDADFIIFYEILMTKEGRKNIESQTELPISAIPWIKDTIVNGFWRTPDDGGLPKDQHAVRKTIAGEDIIVVVYFFTIILLANF
ncbi:hypothetical protein, partial [Aliikangiella maris]